MYFSPFFSLDPGDWADQQPAQPDLGRHHLPHRVRRQAVRILASDQTYAILPRPLCIQIPFNCHLLHLHEGKFQKTYLFDFASQEWAILVAIVPLIVFNMWLTRRTYKLPTATPQQHLRFCTVVGGITYLQSSLTLMLELGGITSNFL